MTNSFSSSVIENLGYYVYLLIHPETNKVFYIGKGQGNRVFQHLAEADMSDAIYGKLETIRSIEASGNEVICLIQRHGLTEDKAFEVESSLIDFVGLEYLTNRVLGHKADDRGQMTINEVIARYDAPIATIVEPSILIIVNKLYYRGMSETDLYEITRKSWKIAPERRRPRLAFAVYNGIVRQVYVIDEWRKSESFPNRWEFTGKIAIDKQDYVGKSVSQYLTLGAQNPIKYVNC